MPSLVGSEMCIRDRSNYAALKEKLNSAGLDKIEKYKTDEYQRRLKEWK